MNLKSIIFYSIILLSGCLQSQSLIGAWEAEFESAGGDPLRTVVIFADGYQVLTTFHAESGAFVDTNGGTWSLDGNTMTEVVEFNSANPNSVGKSVSFNITLTDTTMRIEGVDITFKRLDDGSPGELQNAWLMSGRVRDGQTQTRDTSGPRKTMKILSGTRFQWIAYNTQTQQFMGTGGGSYTTIAGKYTENIEFFSRDDSRVGMSLEFNYELKDGNWHHSGLSSKGDPIYEIWSVRQ